MGHYDCLHHPFLVCGIMSSRLHVDQLARWPWLCARRVTHASSSRTVNCWRQRKYLLFYARWTTNLFLFSVSRAFVRTRPVLPLILCLCHVCASIPIVVHLCIKVFFCCYCNFSPPFSAFPLLNQNSIFVPIYL